ncbi:hypothetical protein B0T19DRAFT_395079 [Cercophora scortea]|uniref:2EXR domain-containing protein n=1 Tax=Cercophora scortea TaxID=314031 RepID=A0AAE0MKN1_9PEZI|nr:hypothetical protein B0T19DRAFT_395079 [Cercophora scortea]
MWSYEDDRTLVVRVDSNSDDNLTWSSMMDEAMNLSLSRTHNEVVKDLNQDLANGIHAPEPVPPALTRAYLDLDLHAPIPRRRARKTGLKKSSRRRSAAGRRFTLFPQLPAELRYMVWMECVDAFQVHATLQCQNRYFRTFDGANQKLMRGSGHVLCLTHGKPSYARDMDPWARRTFGDIVLYCVCRESRYLACLYYGTPRPGRDTVPFYPARDVLVVAPEYYAGDNEPHRRGVGRSQPLAPPSALLCSRVQQVVLDISQAWCCDDCPAYQDDERLGPQNIDRGNPFIQMMTSFSELHYLTIHLDNADNCGSVTDDDGPEARYDAYLKRAINALRKLQDLSEKTPGHGTPFPKLKELVVKKVGGGCTGHWPRSCSLGLSADEEGVHVTFGSISGMVRLGRHR